MDSNSMEIIDDEDVLGKVKKSPFIRRSQVRDFALGYCQRSERLHVRKKNRIGEEFHIALNSAVKEWIRKRVDSQPPVGKTLR